MDLLVVGLNHKTAPVELRERLALTREGVLQRLAALRSVPGVHEAAILSTCNRVEVYAAGTEIEPAALERFLAGLHPNPPERFAEHLYAHLGMAAARHLFEVAASIDSMVVGETEILGQVRAAYQWAREAGAAGRVLHAAFQRALHVAKRIHATTRLGARRVSVGSVAAEFAERIFESLADKAVLVLGAGELAEATLRALQESGARDLRIANRTAARAEELAARVRGRAVPFAPLADQVLGADIVVCCAGAEAPLLGTADFERALRARRNRPIVVVDVAVPRNVDPAAGRLDNLYLFNIDDLQSVVKANLAEREREIERCRPLLERELGELAAAWRAGDLGPLIARMRETYQRLGEVELQRILASQPALAPAQRAEIEAALRRVVGRFIHDQTQMLKGWAQNGQVPRALDVLERLLADAARDLTRPGPGPPT